MSLNLYSDSSASPQQDQAPDGGLQKLNDIERLQNHVLQELEDLDSRIRTVFKTFGYRETEPVGTDEPLAVLDQSIAT